MALFLLFFFALFFGAAFFWPTWRLWRRERVNALVLTYDDTAHGLVGRWFRATLIGIFVLLIVMVAGVPEAAVGRLPFMETELLRWIGWALLGASLLWVVAAQAQMGTSWRIGIDRGSQPPLVRQGVFAVSRNPIFLGMRASLLGLFLVLPNAITLATLLLGEALMQVQVRLEEEHLASAFGTDYEAYRRQVRRWV
jgi:protein-S-isoprenylcysteine O-methyltransferase Ste14